MGSGHSSLEEKLLCCTPSSNTIYDDRQLAVLNGYKEQLGLDKKQLKLLFTTWKSISSEMEAQGVKLFVDIFQSNNEVIHVFPLMNPNLIGNQAHKHVHDAFKEHGSKVISRVNEVLHNLDQLNLCVSLIKQTGAYHRRFQGFKPHFFQHFYEPFLGMVKSCLGKKYNGEVQYIYKTIALFLIQTLIDGYNGETRDSVNHQ